jgi:hypothetical protein
MGINLPNCKVTVRFYFPNGVLEGRQELCGVEVGKFLVVVIHKASALYHGGEILWEAGPGL